MAVLCRSASWSCAASGLTVVMVESRHVKPDYYIMHSALHQRWGLSYICATNSAKVHFLCLETEATFSHFQMALTKLTGSPLATKKRTKQKRKGRLWFEFAEVQQDIFCEAEGGIQYGLPLRKPDQRLSYVYDLLRFSIFGCETYW